MHAANLIYAGPVPVSLELQYIAILLVFTLSLLMNSSQLCASEMDIATVSLITSSYRVQTGPGGRDL